MVLTNEERDAMLEASKPLMKWMSENCHPHAVVHVDSNRVELLEGIAAHGTDEFLKD